MKLSLSSGGPATLWWYGFKKSPILVNHKPCTNLAGWVGCLHVGPEDRHGQEVQREPRPNHRRQGSGQKGAKGISQKRERRGAAGSEGGGRY